VPADEFGSSVAASGGTIVVGAPGAFSDTGSAYAFTNTNGAWTLQGTFGPTDGVSNQFFGRRVSVSGDIAIVDAAPNSAPRVYVYTRSGNAWFAQTILAYPTNAYGDSMAVDGTTAVVGGPNSVIVYTQSGALWNQQATLTPDDYTPQGDFGIQVAISGDVALALAQPSDSSGQEAHFVYVFARSGTTWTQQAKLIPNGLADTNDPHFTFSMGVSGNTAVIAASAGLYVFTRTGTTWSAAPVVASPAAMADTFGNSVATNGASVFVGGQVQPFQGTTGASYSFALNNGVWTLVATLASNLFQDDFGASVAMSGQTAVVGVPAGASPIPMGSGPGIAYVYGCSP
jgi:hypothetical protein